MSKNKRKIIFRADANSEIGLGHIIRTLALADILKDDFNCIFATRLFLPHLEKEILTICNDIIELPKDESHFDIFLHLINGDEIVVLDNYYFDYKFQKKIKEKGAILTCIDDMQVEQKIADIIINHAPGINKEDYPKLQDAAQFCLGPDYSLIRKPFIDAAKNNRTINCINSAFICFGGADNYNLTSKAVSSFIKNKSITKINIVIGNTFKYRDELDNIVSQANNIEIKIFQNLNANEMVELLKSSNIAIVSSSNILLEVLSVKMPVITGYYVNNQKKIYEGYNNLGVLYGCENLLNYNNFDDIINFVIQDDYSKKIEKQSNYFKGEIADKFLEVFKKISNNEKHN